MKPYELKDFSHDAAWLIFRLDAEAAHKPIDIYMLLDLQNNLLLVHEIAETTLSMKAAGHFLNQALKKAGAFPRRILLPKGDPAESFFQKRIEHTATELEIVPMYCCEELIAPIKASFGQQSYSPSASPYMYLKEDTDASDREGLKAMIPDSYALCPCASEKKYKFCCKPIFFEITQAMVAAEEGHLSEALKWIAQAKDRVGETAEVLCRESIVYSYFDAEKSEAILHRCLVVNPKHPRAHYLRGITLKGQGDFTGAIKAYETAIAHYPETDQYHLNEVYNNLGTVFHAMGSVIKAQSCWEKALLYLPSDKTTRRNLNEFIYSKGRLTD